MRHQIFLIPFFITTISFSQESNFEKTGLVYYNNSVYDSALSNFRQCSGSSLNCKYFAAVCTAELKNYDDAIDLYKALAPVKDSDTLLSFVNYEIGLCYSHLHKNDSAIIYFKRQVKLFSHYDSYYMIGHSYYFDNIDSSLKYLKMAEQFKSSNASDTSLNYLIKYTFYIDIKDSSIKYLKNAEQINPSNISDTSLNFMIAHALYDKGSYAESLIYFNKLLDNRPASIELNRVHYLRGQIFYKLNRMTDALNELNLSVQLGYSLSKNDIKIKRKIERALKNKT